MAARCEGTEHDRAVARSSGDSLLDVCGLSITFGGLRALKNVSLCVSHGGLTAVIGPNGAGKTTLFNCISGLYRGEGSIRFEGVEIGDLSAAERTRRGIARTFQTPVLIDTLTVLQNAMLGAYPRTRASMTRSILATRSVRAEEREVRAAAMEMLQRLGLGQVADAPSTGLPHRQRRLLEVARALLARPKLLMLDEPAAGSHQSEAREMLAAVKEIAAAEGVTLLLVEHNVRLVMEAATHVIVLNFGGVLASGTPAEVERDERVIAAYLGEAA